MSRYLRGIRTSIRNNSTAYGYSVMVTASAAALVVLVGRPKVWYLFLFVLGAAAGFAGLEALASNLFREDLKEEEPGRVVALASALSLVSMSLAVGVAALIGWLLSGWAAWLLAPFLATIAYLLVVGAEMTLADRVQR